jgi:formate dehydrogenase maturation protein FdhE
VYEEVGRRLRQEAAGRPELASTIALYCALLEAQARARVEPGAAPDAGEAAARLGEGLPLLAPEELTVDGPALVDLCDEIVCIVAERRPELADALVTVRAWLSREREHLGALAVEYLRDGHIGEGDDADLRAFVLDSALHPFLRAKAQTLAPLLEDGAWYRGSCPVCGGEPDFAALERKNGQRRLLCSRCDSEWAFRRVGCPFCGNDDPRQLAYYPSDDGVYRLSVCEACRRYIKTIDLREAPDERLLMVERVLTVGMDLAAQEAGYRRG